MWVLLFSLSIKGIILLSCLYYASISLCALYLCMPMNPYLCFTIVIELKTGNRKFCGVVGLNSGLKQLCVRTL